MDIEYLLVLQELREAAGPVVEQFFLIVSNVLVGAIMMAVPLVIYWCLDKRKGLFVLATFSIATLLNSLVKSVVCAYRPWVRDPRVAPSYEALSGATGYSFPSGHTQSATSVYGSAGWAWRDRGRIFPILGAVLVALIGFSRNYLGVHMPQDVLFAIMESVLVIWAVERALPWLEDADDARANRVLLASVIITVTFLLFCTLKPYPLDYDHGHLIVRPETMILDAYESAGLFLGAAIGWWLERRYVRFSVEGSRREKIVRVIVGVVIVVVARYGIASPLGGVLGETWKDFLKALLPVVAGMAVVPALFPAIHDKLG